MPTHGNNVTWGPSVYLLSLPVCSVYYQEILEHISPKERYLLFILAII